MPQNGPPAVNMEKLMGNAEQLVQVMGLVNIILCEAIEAPQVWPIPEDGEPRVSGRVYVDTISMEDRFFLFSEVTGGLESLASFR
jgi:hypothetical protein